MHSPTPQTPHALNPPCFALGTEAFTIWMTGLSGAGKSTLAQHMRHRLQQQGRACHVLDGDLLRLSLSNDLGFSREDRREQVRRAAHVARILNEAGVIVMVALVSPYREDRQMAREIIGLPLEAPIGPDRPLREIGVDSLMAVELRNLIARASRLSLPATLLFDFPTISLLVERLAAPLGVSPERPQSVPPEPAPMDAGAEGVDLENLSEAELAALLEFEAAAKAGSSMLKNNR